MNPEQRHSGRVAESQAPSIRDGDAGVTPGRASVAPDKLLEMVPYHLMALLDRCPNHPGTEDLLRTIEEFLSSRANNTTV
jgi:hypothetical protein